MVGQLQPVHVPILHSEAHSVGRWGRGWAEAVPTKERMETFGGRHAIALIHQISDLIPIEFNIEPDANPPVMADVGWYEKPFGVGIHEYALNSRRSFAPHRRSLIKAVLHGENFTSHLK